MDSLAELFQEDLPDAIRVVDFVGGQFKDQNFALGHGDLHMTAKVFL